MVADVASGLAPKKEPRGSHPLLLMSGQPSPRLVLLSRSTSRGPREQRGTKPPRVVKQHGAHNGSCGSLTCQIGKEGFIQSETVSVDYSELDRFSCHEPDEEVINWATSLLPPTPGNTRKCKQ